MSADFGSGIHVCNIHPDFPGTDDSNVWNQHCQETEGHEIIGHYPCISCGNDIDVGEIPYQPIGIETRLQCPNCYGKNQDLNNIVIQRIQQQGRQQNNNDNNNVTTITDVDSVQIQGGNQQQ